MYEIYNAELERLRRYSDLEVAMKAFRGLVYAAVVVKNGKVLVYKKDLSQKEQARIRDAIAEQYEAQNKPQKTTEESVGKPDSSLTVEQPPAVSSPGHTVSGSVDHPPVQLPVLLPTVQSPAIETITAPIWEGVTDPRTEVSSETVAKVMPPECKTEYCGRPALRITEHTRPEHHGLCKRCRDRSYTRAANKTKPITAPIKPTQPLAERIGALLIEAFAQTHTPEQQEVLQLGEIIGIETLRAIAKRVQK